MDALKLVLGMVNAFVVSVAAFQGDELPTLARVLLTGVGVACGFGLMFMEKVGKRGDETARRRRKPTPLEVAGQIEDMTPEQRRIVLKIVEPVLSRDTPPHG